MNQNKFILSLFEAPKQGTPTGIVVLDLNMLTYVGNVMEKTLPNIICRRALIKVVSLP